MGRTIIICITIITINLIKFSHTTENSSLSKDSVDCLNNRCINKCCPNGQFVAKGKKCQNAVYPFMLKSIKVYDENYKYTGKSVQDWFNIAPGRFISEPIVQEKGFLWSSIGYIPHVLENGDLMLEMPNFYKRWNPVKNGNFCIDYTVSNGTVKPMPKIWSIMEVPETEEADIYFTSAMLVSCLFLLLVLVVYFLLPELQNLCGLILMAYVASLFMAFLLLATIRLSTFSVLTCLSLTLGIYYFFLASFCWMSVMSLDIWWTFRGYAKARPIHRRGERFKFLMYCIYAWGLPLFMAIALGILNETDMTHVPWLITPHIPSTGCFLDGGTKMVYLYVPMLTLIVCNWIFYLMTAFNVWRLSRGTAVLDSAAAGTPAAHRTQWHRFMVYLKLSVVMGLNWVFEFTSFVYPEFKGWCISDIYNILIGLAIFLIFVCKKKIYRKLYKRYYYVFNNNKRSYPGSSKSYSSSNSDSGTETVTLQVCNNPKGTLNGYAGSMRSM